MLLLISSAAALCHHMAAGTLRGGAPTAGEAPAEAAELGINVTDWLASHGLGKYAAAFARHEYEDLSILRGLDALDFNTLRQNVQLTHGAALKLRQALGGTRGGVPPAASSHRIWTPEYSAHCRNASEMCPATS